MSSTLSEQSFSGFKLVPKTREMFYRNQPIECSDRIFDFLLLLLRNPGECVSKDTILSDLWPGQFVSEASLSRLVSDTRQLLAQYNSDEEFIHTIRAKGFRFNPAIAINTNDQSPTNQANKKAWLTPVLIVASVVLLGITGAAIWNQFISKNHYYSAGNTVVVLPVNVQTNDAQDDWIEYGVMTLLSRQLQAYEGISIVDMNSVVNTLPTIGFDHALSSQEKYDLVCEALGCDVLLLSTFQLENNRLALQYSLIKQDSRSPTFTFIHSNPLEAAYMMNEHALIELLPSLSERLELKHLYSDNVSANQFFALGANSLYLADYPAAEQNLKLAIERSPNFFWANAYLADTYYKTGRYAEAVQLLDTLQQDNLETRQIIYTENLRANLQYAVGELNASISSALAIIPLTEAVNDFELMGIVLMNTGSSYTALGQTQEAKDYLNRALLLFLEHGFKLREAQARMNLGNALWIEDYGSEAAEEQYQQADIIFQQYNAKGYIAFVLNGLSGIQVARKNFAEARELQLQVSNIYQQVDDQEGILLVETDLANIAMQSGDLIVAEQHALTAYDGAGDTYTYVRSHASAILAQVYLRSRQTDKIGPLLEERKQFGWFDPRPAFSMLNASFAHITGDYGGAVGLAQSLKEQLGDQWTDLHQSYLDAFSLSREQGNQGEFDYLNGVWHENADQNENN